MKNKAFNSSHRFGKKRHIGRSMIEMLGVLAIIGVLSIGGLAAYRQAMIRYRANELTNYIERVRMVVMEICPDGTANCPLFDDNVTSASERIKKVCSLMGSDCQLFDDPTKDIWAALPGSTPAYWRGWNVTKRRNGGFEFYITRLPREICSRVVDNGGYGIYSYRIYSRADNWITLQKDPTKPYATETKVISDVCNDATNFAGYLAIDFDF